MIRSRVKIQLDDIAAKVEQRRQTTQAALDEQVLKDSNSYAPQDTSELINSGIRNSQIGQGLLMWNTPYARRLYYNPQYNFSKDVNPQAQGLWFEAAKASHLPVWLQIARNGMGGV